MDNFRDANITSIIGNTPIIRLQKVVAHLRSEIYVKLEFTNPGGSVKDRAGVYMCRKAVENGELLPGGTIVEGTSGNTGVGVALFANVYGHPSIFVMGEKQSADKVANLKAFGAKVVLCPSGVGFYDPGSYHSVACALADRLGALHLNQHSNPNNAESHYVLTGPEILRQTGGAFDVFMAGAGTGGTITGAGRFLKERIPGLKVIGVDCRGSVLAQFHRRGRGGPTAPYLLEGIGEEFVPGNLDLGIVDDFEVVGDEESFRMARRLLTEEGIYAGGSSGGAVVAAIRYAVRQANPQRILAILPDSGSRYASQFYNDAWMEQKGYPVGRAVDALDEGILGVIGESARLA